MGPKNNSLASSRDVSLPVRRGSLPELARSVAELLENAKQLLSPANVQRLSEVTTNLHALSVTFPRTMARADVLLDDGDEALRIPEGYSAVFRFVDPQRLTDSPTDPALASRLKGVPPFKSLMRIENAPSH